MSHSTGTRTDALLAVPPRPVGDDARARVRDRLVDGVAGAVAGLPPGGLVEVALPSLRRARSRPESVGLAEPDFAWKPVFARRSLGLAAVRACVEGRFGGPAAAVGPLADRAVDEWRRSGWRTFHWEPWFDGLGAGGRAAVLAEATTWATPLWAAFDWAEFGPGVVLGGADDQWTCPGPRAVRLKGRCEVRVTIDPPGGPADTTGTAVGASALVSVSGGSPGGDWPEELSYLALVAGLRSTDRPVPARVLGLWPEAGAHRMVEVDGGLLGAAADRVVTTVALTAVARSNAPDVGGTVSTASEEGFGVEDGAAVEPALV